MLIRTSHYCENYPQLSEMYIYIFFRIQKKKKKISGFIFFMQNIILT